MNSQLLFLTISFISLISILSFGQDQEIITVQGEAQVGMPEYKSMMEVKQEAEEYAIIDALEKAFGIAVIEGNTTFVQDVVTKERVETNTVFNSIANTLVKGEVIEVLDKQFALVYGEILIEGKKRQLKEYRCTVKIRAREFKDNPVDFEMFPLKCLDIHCKATTFNAGKDDFYIYFRCPVSGYLAIYLDDGEHAQRLLPYRQMGPAFEQGVPVIANTEYFLFSNEEPYQYFDATADEYVFETDQLVDQDRLFVVFSNNLIVQPYIEKDYGSDELSEAEREVGWRMPDALASEDFQRWLINSRIKNRDIVVEVEDITIKR